ncbi:hypothetical protein TSH100_24120 [Azospirillum sp. TSH100]|uniref:hypothetical protein n=1 Tax=Azospirillum sp. TSH100 TaxID=652764 RepID=UPI000D613993|nr:hypothetical protein [Azospirillum sp. TSH100]PWC82303.1 hypothetical protein TSH100_24120 [Azospirillum sp. TSH100]QCG86913.1 hypothetical protein E6C72_03675 [Azospirillum sp. TSH100]
MLSPAAPALPAPRLSRAVPLKAEPYSVEGEPFAGAEEAWFWAVQAQDAKAAGARIVAGCGQIARPCEPQDVLQVVDRLYRTRKLLRDHLHVLVHYGRRQSAPEPERFREQRAHALWQEAFGFIAPALRNKGIVRGIAR